MRVVAQPEAEMIAVLIECCIPRSAARIFGSIGCVSKIMLLAMYFII
jgi:hypothetical protein